MAGRLAQSLGIRGTLVALVASCFALGASPAMASFHITSFDGQATDAAGASLTQAGAHPDVRVDINFPATTNQRGFDIPDGNAKAVTVDLPPGLVGNPTAIRTCREEELLSNPLLAGYFSGCPAASVVGIANVTTTSGVVGFPVANLDPPPGVAAQFGFNVYGAITKISVLSRQGGRQLVAEVKIPQAAVIIGTSLTLWGVPGDPVHDALRGGEVFPGAGLCGDGTLSPCPQHDPLRAFMSNPTNCAAGPVTTGGHASSWQEPTVVHDATFVSHLTDGTPSGVTHCAVVPFAPTLVVQPTVHGAHAPTGLDVDLEVPQDQSPDGLATAHLKKVTVKLPDGMAVNPSSADGLAACAPSEIGLGSNSPVTCPDASKIGSVEIETPLLADPLKGDVYLAKQTDNPFGSLLALYVVAANADRGVIVKLAGKVTPDGDTGRLEATFDDNPQLPFDKLHLHFNGGPRAPLVNLSTCGTKTAAAELASWSGKTVTSSNSFDVTGCGASQFKPALDAGLVNPAAGSSSAFTLRVQRADADNELKTVSTSLPPGLLAKIAGVPLCSSAQAAAASCPAGSQIGRVEVGAGAGSNPFYVNTGKVFLTEGYRGGPYGLDIAVPAVAGPFDLGVVNVRAAVNVDPTSAQVSVDADPMPRILQGIPLQVKDLRVIVDRGGFMQAPTSCRPMAVGAKVGSYAGDAADVSNRFQVGDCASLGFKPKMAMRLTNKSQTTDGRHPGLDVLVTQGSGEAHLKQVVAKLPLSLALDPENAQALCEYATGLAVRGGAVGCPKTSEIGTATAVSPLLNRPLYGKVYFVKGVRFNSKGQAIRTLPTLLIPLRGEINVDLRASSEVDDQGRLVTTFANVPDAAISGFRLQLRGGKHGILVVTHNQDICRGKQVTDMESDGQNGKLRDAAVTMKTPCAAAAAKARRGKARRHAASGAAGRR